MLSRRELIAGLTTAIALARTRAWAADATPAAPDAASAAATANALLDDLAWQLLELVPGRAT